MLDIELDDLDEIEYSPPDDKDICNIKGCQNDSTGTLRFTDGKRYGKVRLCESCFEKSKTERPKTACYSCGTVLFIEEIWW